MEQMQVNGYLALQLRVEFQKLLVAGIDSFAVSVALIRKGKNRKKVNDVCY